MKNKKGFTLVELLAVMVILIIIIIIAYAVIKRNVDQTLDNTIKANAGIYIKAANSLISEKSITDANYDTGLLSVSQLNSEGLKISGTKPDSGYVFFTDAEVTNSCLVYEDYYIQYSNGNLTDPRKGQCSNFKMEYPFEFTKTVQTFKAPFNGKYTFELWGAQGGEGGKGGYTYGEIELTKNTILYVYVGEVGSTLQSITNVGGWNGGGYSGNNSASYSYGGGGATDVRTVNGEWNDPESLRSRIMVAGGGGGSFSSNSYAKSPGVGGNLKGGTGSGSYGSDSYNGGGGKQTSYSSSLSETYRGSFGSGPKVNTDGFGGGGGGGYWGGSNGYGRTGGGGSSFISGYTGCVAVISDASNSPRLDSNGQTCVEDTIDNTCSIHYSGKIFTNGVMKSGAQEMPTHDGNGSMTGNEGDGYAKITYIGS